MDKIVSKARENLNAGKDVFDGIDESQRQGLMSRYAEFQDSCDGEGFVSDSSVLVKSLHTPRPYLHLMASNHCDDYGQWGSYWDQHRGGFSCVDTVVGGNMMSHLDTNYVPTAPEPQDVREFFVHENGKAWPMFPVAGYEEQEYQDYSCSLGLDQYELNATRDGLACKLRVCVHPELSLELWQLSVVNTSQAKREFSVFTKARVNVDSYPFYYFVPRVVCEGLLEDDALVFVNHDQNNKHKRTAFFAGAEKFDGYDMMGEIFDGGVGRAILPKAVAQGACFNTLGKQPYAGLVAAVQQNAAIEPGESKTWTFAFGLAPDDKAKREEFMATVKSEVLSDGDAVFEAVNKKWQENIFANAIKTPDHQLNRYYNIWSKYQSRNQSRFIRDLDKIGYRDILQDIMGVIDFQPEYVRAKLIEALRYQYPNGRAVRQYEKYEGGGHDLRMYQDSVVWIADTLTRYIKQTGDFDLLDVEIPYLNEQTLQPDANDTGSLYDHACRAIRSLWTDSGYNGLCAIGYGDWNDALSGIGGENGVSVWLSCAFVYASELMAKLAERIGRDEDAKEFTEFARVMTQRINDHAWDGEWYIYAINSQGEPIGSNSCEEGKMHLNVNTWALFTGIAAAAGREEQVWKSIEKLATPTGHRLLWPAYTEISRESVGRIADQMCGMFENGSIYTHGEAFYLFAMANCGRCDELVI